MSTQLPSLPKLHPKDSELQNKKGHLSSNTKETLTGKNSGLKDSGAKTKPQAPQLPAALPTWATVWRHLCAGGWLVGIPQRAPPSLRVPTFSGLSWAIQMDRRHHTRLGIADKQTKQTVEGTEKEMWSQNTCSPQSAKTTRPQHKNHHATGLEDGDTSQHKKHHHSTGLQDRDRCLERKRAERLNLETTEQQPKKLLSRLKQNARAGGSSPTHRGPAELTASGTTCVPPGTEAHDPKHSSQEKAACEEMTAPPHLAQEAGEEEGEGEAAENPGRHVHSGSERHGGALPREAVGVRGVEGLCCQRVC